MCKKIIGRLVIISISMIILSGCAGKKESENITVTVFAAKSLNGVMDEIVKVYNEENTEIDFITNYDSSGILQTQIEEGADCDVFFSAAQKQMDALEGQGLVVAGTRCDVVNNQVCVVTTKGSDTKVTGLDNIGLAESLALAAGSVPVGKYTRVAMVNSKLLPECEDPSVITTGEVADALGGVVINECANVGAVAVAVAEGVNEVGTVYYSDYKGYEDRMDIIEIIPNELTGDVIYPVAQIVNRQASDGQQNEAVRFISFLKSNKAKEIFEKYYFDTKVE